MLNGSGTTEHAHIGVGGDGITPNQYAIPTSGSGAYLVFTGEGGSASDYRWYRDASNLPAGEVDSGSLPATHPSYLAGGTNASLPFYQALFPSPPAATPGSPGLMWTTVEIEVDQTAGTIKMSMDGTLIIDGAFAGDLDGLVSLGLADIFTSLSGPTNFILYDNLTVETNPSFPRAELLHGCHELDGFDRRHDGCRFADRVAEQRDPHGVGHADEPVRYLRHLA